MKNLFQEDLDNTLRILQSDKHSEEEKCSAVDDFCAEYQFYDSSKFDKFF